MSDITRTTPWIARIAAGALGLAAAPCMAGPIQDRDPDQPPAETERETETEDGAAADRDADAPPSLDDLLGIPADESDSSSARDAAEREAREALERELTETAIRDAFTAALEKMGLTADLLENQLDGGLGTQRLQEEILRKLDELIDSAQKQPLQSSGASSSSSSSSSRGQSSQPRPQPQPGTQPAGQERPDGATDSSPGGPPPRRDGDINTVLEETRSEWGHLPPRFRDEMDQGYTSRYSSLYRKLTEAYYEKLAEDR